jgi:hypothetical protein
LRYFFVFETDLFIKIPFLETSRDESNSSITTLVTLKLQQFQQVSKNSGWRGVIVSYGLRTSSQPSLEMPGGLSPASWLPPAQKVIARRFSWGGPLCPAGTGVRKSMSHTAPFLLPHRRWPQSRGQASICTECNNRRLCLPIVIHG